MQSSTANSQVKNLVPPSTTHYRIGADPELFLQHCETKQNISGHDFLKGTKYNPEPVGYGAVQVDGTAVEFNIDPADTLKEFMNNIRSVMGQLKRKVQSHNPRVDLDFSPYVAYPEEYFKTLPDHAKELGCDPDFNAWNGGAVNPKPNAKATIRTASGHIHIGWISSPLDDPFDEAHMADCIVVTKQLDAALYLPSLLWDSNPIRRTMYGQMGTFRPKPYGVEYRVLSNVWLTNQKLWAWLYLATIQAMQLLDMNVDLFKDEMFEAMIENKDATYSHQSLVLYYEHLRKNYNFPRLPAEYLQIKANKIFK